MSTPPPLPPPLLMLMLLPVPGAATRGIDRYMVASEAEAAHRRAAFMKKPDATATHTRLSRDHLLALALEDDDDVDDDDDDDDDDGGGAVPR